MLIQLNEDRAIRAEDIVGIDAQSLEDLGVVYLWTDDHVAKLDGVHAIQALYRLCPSLLEGKRLKYQRHAWLLHNLVGHPMMQLFAALGLYRAAFWFHDVTIPRPE